MFPPKGRHLDWCRRRIILVAQCQNVNSLDAKISRPHVHTIAIPIHECLVATTTTPRCYFVIFAQSHDVLARTYGVPAGISCVMDRSHNHGYPTFPPFPPLTRLGQILL